MATALIQAALTLGEVAPALFGREDLARLHVAAATMRNMWPAIQGGGYSRAGTEFAGFSKQTGRAYPPKLIPFQFNINQGLTLEFGNFYMRVVFDGGYVTESPFAITGASQTNPCQITYESLSTALSATPNNGAVSASYARGDTVAIAGGTFVTPAVFQVVNSTLVSATLNAAGTGYAPNDLVTLLGGTAAPMPVLTVQTTKVVSATIAAGGTGGTPGTQTVTGTTGTGTKFQALVTVSGGGVITAVLSITVGGSYTVNPSNPAIEPVTGASLAGAALNVVLGISTFAVSSGGVFTANGTGNFTQYSTTGSGTGATFQSGIFGPNSLTVFNAGSYSVVPSNPANQASSSGAGSGATYTVTWATPSALANLDWVYIADVEGMTELNGRTFVINNVTATTFNLYDVYGNPIDATAYGAWTSGGTAARIYTLTTPYAEEDLDYLKYTQSADVMSLCLVNQTTLTEYAPLDLTRLGATNWTLSEVVTGPTVSPPATTSAAKSSGGSVTYQYQVTAVSPDDGTESVASPIAQVDTAVNIAATAGTITITWSAVAGVNEYNIYKATPGLSATPPAGSLFGYAGSAYGTQFIDSNIVADMAQVPPEARNPFARGQITGVTPGLPGSSYTSVTVTINSLTGSGAVIEGVIVSGAIVAYIVRSPGKNYLPTDTITISGSGGSGATATLVVGPLTGTYPGVPAYFQQRRAYGYTLNTPDTYFMSQPGAYTNFDRRIPTIDTDAIIGNPWAVQVNGIQYMIQMPGGLIVMTGLSAWLLTGTGGGALNPQPITPSSQDAQPQANNGCAPKVPPLKIDFDVIFVQAKGSIYRRFNYQLGANIYTGEDMTINSPHLFTGYTTVTHAWCEAPNKLLWSVRSDGALISAVIEKPQSVLGWSRHDTNGQFVSCCSITELPVDALYVAVKRVIGGETAYTVERMNDRLWPTIEDCWCVDCGLSLPQPQPNAVLNVSSATGLGALTGVTDLVGGSGYSAATVASVVDDNGKGPGTGAVPTLTIVGGVITAIAFNPGDQGTGYVSPKIVISDPENSGQGAAARAILDNTATFTASAAVFAPGDVGSVIRAAGGIATITAYVNATTVQADISVPITQTQPNSGTPPLVPPQPAGTWTLTEPVMQVGGLWHLVGATVTGLADGNPIDPQVVAEDGTITLATPASSVTVGLGFTAQLQSVYLDSGNPTIQGQRKKIAAATARVQASRGFTIGSNQTDGSTLSPAQLAPTWYNMVEAETLAPAPYNSDTKPLYTGDIRVPVVGGFNRPGQVAFEQSLPLPMEILAIVPEMLAGDTPSQKAKER